MTDNGDPVRRLGRELEAAAKAAEGALVKRILEVEEMIWRKRKKWFIFPPLKELEK